MNCFLTFRQNARIEIECKGEYESVTYEEEY